MAALTVLSPFGIQAQFGPLRHFDTDRALPQVFRLNSASIDAGAYWLGLPASTGLPYNQLPIGSTFNGGWSADGGWYIPGRRAQAFLEYQVNYEGDPRY